MRRWVATTRKPPAVGATAPWTRCTSCTAAGGLSAPLRSTGAPTSVPSPHTSVSTVGIEGPAHLPYGRPVGHTCCPQHSDFQIVDAGDASLLTYGVYRRRAKAEL